MQKKMMAANLHAVGDLRYEEVPVPECAMDEVLVAVKYCGICGSDVGRVLKTGTYHFPTIPGHEFSGVVEYDPKGELTGRHVSVFPLIPCRECDMCEQEAYALCRRYDYYGSRRDGGYAEYIAVKRWNLVFLPDGLSLEEGALCEPASVAHSAVSRLGIREGDSVLISGAGPIGLLAAQWAKIYGAEKVCLFDIAPDKMEYAKSMGFLEYTDDMTVDCALEGTGYGDALARCLSAVRPRGRMVLMGNPARAVELSQDAYWCILRKELTLVGTWNSDFSDRKNDWAASVEAMAGGRLNAKAVISHVFPLSECGKAFQVLTDKNTFTNRVVLKIGD